jgi:hypothetical protein
VILASGKNRQASNGSQLSVKPFISLPLANYRQWVEADWTASGKKAAKFLQRIFLSTRDSPYVALTSAAGRRPSAAGDDWLQPRICDKPARWFSVRHLGRILAELLETRNGARHCGTYGLGKRGDRETITVRDANFQPARLETSALAQITALLTKRGNQRVGSATREPKTSSGNLPSSCDPCRKSGLERNQLDIHHISFLGKRWCESHDILFQGPSLRLDSRMSRSSKAKLHDRGARFPVNVF